MVLWPKVARILGMYYFFKIEANIISFLSQHDYAKSQLETLESNDVATKISFSLIETTLG